MLRVCPSGLKALIFVNTTPFPMTHGSGLYRYSMGQRTQMLLLCQYFRRHLTELRISPLVDKKCYALCNKEKGRFILSRCRSVGDE
jgi:hypothetical protein